MPNSFAFLVLGLWPLMTVVIFMRLPVGRAVLTSLMVAYLLLPPPPAAFDFPLLPPLNKETLPSLAALLVCLVLYRDRIKLLPQQPMARALVLLFIFSPLATSLTNTNPVFFGHFGLPGLGLKDAVSIVVQQFILVVPFLLARNFLNTANDQRDLLLALSLAGLVYSLPMLIEVRLSPQLNIWIYGYFQHNFEQMIRQGGFRPIVFLYHGLWVAFLAMMSLVATAILLRTETGKARATAIGAVFYMVVVLVLCKSLGSLLYAMFLLPAVVLLPKGLQLRIALVLALLAVGYPVLKGAGLVPEQAMLEQATKIDTERAGSLKFRFDNENTLLDRANEKPLFGWGSWGRNHILDPDSGRIMTVTDGRWVILIGMFGWVGFLAEFGLLALPIVLLWAKTRGSPTPVWSPYIGGLSLLLAVNMVDLLPNATLTPLTWLIAGALLGYAETAKPAEKVAKMKLRSIM
ncbi:hypothetical protein [Thalassovita taeanensis]|uniref:O-antigen ligase like membrane protein n=1 Tax=Thalassovita taeanensis TaxID=657014 RepID=A0A1H9C3X5_9RHOB|nr:hypothetical protein [Thalassovita taeanensis]SEP95388.1 hypothetical protein SAMN04488092_103101 [Thalassovita taeanensis]